MAESDQGLVVAVFGPTASGKTSVAEALAERIPAEIVSADAMQVYRGLPVLANQSERASHLVAIWPLAHEGSVAEYQRLAHAAIDDVLGRGRTPVVAGGTGLYLRAALSDLALPPAPGRGRTRTAGGALRPCRRRERARPPRRGGSRSRCRRAPERPPPRRPGARAGRGGLVARPEQSRLWTEDTRHPTLVVGLDVPREELERRIAERTAQMWERGGWRRRSDGRWRTRSRQPRRRSTASAKLPSCRGRQRRPRSSSAPAATPPTSESGCAASPTSLPFGPTAPRTRSPMRFSKWHALGNAYLVVERPDLPAP